MQGAHRYFKRNVSKVIEASKRFGRVYKPHRHWVRLRFAQAERGLQPRS